jgi:hypothetical protein
VLSAAQTSAAEPHHSLTPNSSSTTSYQPHHNFFSVLSLCDPFLTANDKAKVTCVASGLAPNDRDYLLYPSDPPTLPRQMYRRRAIGFGRAKIGLYTSHDSPGLELMVHHAWKFLSNDDRATLARADIFLFSEYASLRHYAFTHRSAILQLRAPRPPIDAVQPLCPTRSRQAGAALLLFDFNMGDFLRWMGGEYTNSHRDLSHYEAQVAQYAQIPSIPGHPPLDCDRLLAIQREGVPLQGRFNCTRQDTLHRLQYDNHPPLKTYYNEVRSAFAKEEASSYHMHFPRFIAHFLYGLFICPISWVIKKGKGRLVIDGSTPLKPNDTGAPNTYIPRCGTPGKEDECPPVYYGNAMQRHLKWVWNLRIDHPHEDLLQHTDDINAAFRRGTYHCDINIAFAYVFAEFLLIPIGMIFGARNSPSWFDIMAEWRSHLGTTKDYSNLSYPISDQVQLVPDLTADERAAIPPALPDSQNQGIPPELRERGQISMFVDDNCAVDIRNNIIGAIGAAVGSAYECFGFPNEDRRLPCLRDDKFDLVASFCVLFLGFYICTRRMAVILPVEKVQALRNLLETEWLPQPPLTTIMPKSPKDIAILLGHVRSGCLVFPLGNFISIRLTQVLTTVMKQAGAHHITSKNWWRKKGIHIPALVIPDIHLLHNTLTKGAEDQAVAAWTRPIGCIIQRDPTCIALSDAAYTGCGGWSPHFRFMWRLTRNDLVQCGFDMKLVAQYASEPNHDAQGLHINLLEFVAIAINLWLSTWFIRKDPGKPGGHVLLIRADNTSALSWLRHSARCHSPPVRNLSYFTHALFIFSGIHEYTQMSSNHIKGSDNGEADACSRPEKFPSLDSAIAQFSQLQTCQPFLLPYGLLSTIATIISSPKIEDTFEQQMTKVMTLAPHISPNGYSASTGSIPGFYKRSHRTKHSR